MPSPALGDDAQGASAGQTSSSLPSTAGTAAQTTSNKQHRSRPGTL
eukprot:CAMPEP_0177419664 /NCGR_PEP_ID=MMETSP0368-20130122/69846_1 /TAXON_ID=447022 ORGANISM="Scrippsiella hangoei-like, Strain SHHI-4" /NCGR_SAMPLE_ID=MMETSP0368 /ASSEMBLY_ACC=CAM_ASM_000363 /LENGTH=45 /DNA_ID= /DNA_START= /DNA_END= /DNA_ORIENTATION=